MEYLNHTPAKRSGFVTGIAWTFIALAGFATIIAILQLVMLSVLFSGDEFQYAIREAGKSFSMPPFVLVIFENFRFIFMSLFALSAATLVASIGLLMRHNWARVVFIAIMAVGILTNLAGVALPFFASSWLLSTPAIGPTEIGQQFAIAFKIITFISVIMALVSAWICWWLMKRLMDDEIKREFGAA